MRESTVQLVEEAVALIEEKVKEPFWLDSLAGGLYISKFHLHRLFKALTGKTLMAYVRGRRLSRSLGELIHTDAKISDIAEEYCFNYEQSYERAFKNEFGVSPTAFRKSPCGLKITNMLDTSALCDIAGGICAEPHFFFMPQITIAGKCTFVPADDYMKANEAALSFWYHEREKIPSRLNEHIYYGFAFPIAGKEYDYMPSVESAGTGTLPPGFERRIFPACHYAVFRYVGFHSPDVLSEYYIGDIYNYIESEWSSKTIYRRNRAYHFERMDTTLCSPTYCEADIYIPLIGSTPLPVRIEKK
jgi:AraC family transcriptional regulator